MIGQTLSHYRIIEKLGGGGMGVVYKAEDLTLRRIVALKFLPPQMTRDADAKARFVAEARAASAIDHPNICTIHEIDDTSDSQVFIAMSYYGGESLKRRVDQGPLGVTEAVRIATEAAQGLAKAHATGIIHRDIKPANIMLTDEGQVKIVDFGLAKLAGRSRTTCTGTTMGTIAYMSPEQARGESADERADVWALGVVLHEMLVGELPFKGDHEQALVYNILNSEPQRITDARRDVPAALERIVERAIEKRREGRYPTMSALAKDLQELSRLIARGELRERWMPFHMRRRQARALGIAAVALLAVLAGAAIVVWRLRVGAAAPVALAVLPFENLSGDPSDDWIAKVVTESLDMDLRRIARLKVASKDLARRAAEGDASIPEIARTLHVTWVVTGSVIRDKETNRTSVSAKIHRAAQDEVAWSERYPIDLAEILSVQEEITPAIAAEIRVEVAPLASTPAQTELPPDANERFRKGGFHAARLTPASLALSVGCYRQAIELAPRYAPAYADLAHAYHAQGSASVGTLEPRVSAEMATVAARQALRLDRSLGSPHRVLGEIKRDYDWDFEAADAEMDLARAASPDDPVTLTELARLRLFERRYADALDLARRAQALNPTDAIAPTLIGQIYAALGKLPQAIAELGKVLDYEPSFVPALEALGTMRVRMRAWGDAIAVYEKAMSLAPESIVLKARLAFAYARAGRRADAEKARTEIEAQAAAGPVPSIAFALVDAGLGQTERALDWLEKAAGERTDMMPQIPFSPEWDSVRQHPRFVAIMGKAGLTGTR